MSPTDLPALLREADRSAPPLGFRTLSGEQMLAVVQRRQVRRRRRIQASSVVAVVLAAAWLVWPTTNKPADPTLAVVETSDPADAAEIGKLLETLRQLSRSVESPAASGAEWADSTSPVLDADVLWRREVARSAAISFYHAQSVEEENGAAAAGSYRRVAERFPDTKWAALAERRVKQLTPESTTIHPL